MTQPVDHVELATTPTAPAEVTALAPAKPPPPDPPPSPAPNRHHLGDAIAASRESIIARRKGAKKGAPVKS